MHIETDKFFKHVQQKPCPIPFQDVDKFETLLDKFEENGVGSRLLGSEWDTGCVHNPVIMEKKGGMSIRLTLDKRTIVDVVHTSYFLSCS